MKNLNLTQIISDASASGREHSFAPQNNYGNASLISKKVQNVKSGQSAQSLLAESGADAQSGRSMIEMLGVLAIIGVLSVGGIAGYSKAMQKYRINKTIEQITLIAGNIRSFTASQPADRRYEGLDNSDVIKKAKLVPDEMWNGDNIKDIWDGDVSLEDDEYKNLGDSFVIHYHNVPEEACIELITYDWQNVFSAMTLNNTTLIQWDCEHDNYGDDYYFCKKNGLWPVDVDKAVTACSSKCSSGCVLSFAGR